MTEPSALNPCVTCGACCAHYRVSFHWSEADATLGGVTPEPLTVKLTAHHAALRGTEHAPPRCVALVGNIGKRVDCSIYALRPSPCRELQASWSNGKRNDRCDQARAAHGLPPLAPPHDAQR